jgi:hypothetical protein
VELSGLLHAQDAFTPGKNPGAHWTGGWVGPTACSAHFEKENLLLLAGFEPFFLSVFQIFLSPFFQAGHNFTANCSSLKHKFQLNRKNSFISYLTQNTFHPLVGWIEHLAVPFVKIPTNSQGSSGVLLIRSKVSTPTCFGTWLPSSGGREYLIS